MIIVLSTYPDLKTGRKAAEQIVEKRLAACVSIVKIEESVYRWKGKVEKRPECMLIMKTTAYRPLESFVRQNHPHEVPEIIQIEVTEGNRDYLSWVKENSASSAFSVPLDLRAATRAALPSRESSRARKPKTSSR